MREWWGLSRLHHKQATQYSTVRKTMEYTLEAGFFTPAEDLITFFESDWCEDLCLCVGVSLDSYLDRIRAGPLPELREQPGCIPE